MTTDRPSVEDARAALLGTDAEEGALDLDLPADDGTDLALGRVQGYAQAVQIVRSTLDRLAASRAVPSDHTATTEDAVADLLERMARAVNLLEGLRGEHWDPAERQRLRGKVEGVKLAIGYVEETRDLLATARPDTTTDLIDTPAVREVQAQALEAAAAEARRMPADPDKAAAWLRERAAAIREAGQ